MKRFGSIEQFRNVVKQVRLQHDFKGIENESPIYNHTSDYPILKFSGTVKLHGTNAGVIRYSDGRTEFQSRERVLSLEYDNAGFMSYMMPKDLDFLFNIPFKDYIAVYGEWCGKGIQKGVAISELDKMFVIFGVKVDDKWIEIPKHFQDPINRIFTINQFPTFKIDIDFNSPELSQNKLIDLTNQVEECCPVGEYFGVKGIGEGIVFSCVDNPELRFKSKGEKHSSSKVKVLNSVNVEELESCNEFIEASVTENRLNQAITFLKENGFEVSPKSLGEFIRWMVVDILKEESDTILENNLDEKRIKTQIAVKSRVWFLNNF
jgi:RNA ligase